MFLSFKEVGTNSVVRVSLDKILYYQPSPNSAETTVLFLQNDVAVRIASKVEDIDKLLSFTTGVKDINGHLVRSV